MDRSVAPGEDPPDGGRRLGDVPGLQRAMLFTGIALVVVGIGLTLGGIFGGTPGFLGPLVALTGSVLTLFQKLTDLSVRTALVILGLAVVAVPLVAWASSRWAPSTQVVLDGDLTVAFVPLSVDADGVGDDAELGEQLAQGLQRELVADAEPVLAAASLSFGTEVLGRAPFAGDAETQSRQAEELAQRTHADFVVAGHVEVAPVGTTITPQLYVAADRVPDAPELAGWYDGAALRRAADLRSDPNALAEVYRELGGSVSALVQVGLALQELATGDASESERRLEAVVAAGHFGVVSEELTSLFLGNASGAAACAGGRCTSEGLDQASEAYVRALELAPASMRPQVGLAEVALQRGQRRCTPGEPPVETLLREAEAAFRRVADEGEGLSQAKAKLGLARAQACRVLAGATTDGAVVDAMATELTSAAGDDRSRSRIAGEGQSWRGLVARHLGRPADAVTAFTTAVELAEGAGARDRRALWLGFLAETLAAPPLCDATAAADRYEAAIAQYDFLLDEAGGSARQRLEGERAELADLQAQPAEGC